MTTNQWQTPEGQRWLGRAAALLEQSGNLADSMEFNVAVQGLSSYQFSTSHAGAVQRMTTILYRALARAELQASPSSSGAFIPVGETFSAFAALSRILCGASNTVMFVDPYADANLLTDFAVLVPDGVSVRILADAGSKKAAFPPAVKHWVHQYASARPLEARLAPERSLHDRLIIIDEREAWSLGQSFNALAARAPTSLIRADAETARLKIEAHNQAWQTATPIN
ncbi:phosphatidylserine/phosphatidylglycerophosphate/cardiolipin synthase family protein [Pseudomonas sp. NBRC 111140]|uniref:phosphatidylserine/phosphatidylglycerophosphate/ cardiolipin synthase family protein n=1 Tax=Pseudomonas sp. NBRC 111140 TaxID=1661055 RepID=UPI0012E29D7C|nr:phosphatidylserine/phosphatidylglycerophosphate/cardiolipin synthase family protein [Pseudomonas sp. NBRC 111140]